MTDHAIEYVRYQVGADRRDQFLAAYAEAACSLRAAPECLAYELAECADDASGVFILRIQWISVDAHLREFRTGPHFAEFLRAVRPFIKDIAEMRHYLPTSLEWKR